MDEMHRRYQRTGSQLHDIDHSSSSRRSTPDQICDVTFDAPINTNADQTRSAGFDETPVQSTLPTHSTPQEVNPEVRRSTIQTHTSTMGTRERSRSN